ncbi:hypothetical protein ACLB2K_026221 [Fragaria x ananassa]
MCPWIKLKNDGLVKGGLGPTACGGNFRGEGGGYIGGYCGMALLMVGERFYKHYKLFQVLHRCPFLAYAWHNCLAHLRSMHFRCSHIFREGNTTVDGLANLGLVHSSLTFILPPMEIHSFLTHDAS